MFIKIRKLSENPLTKVFLVVLALSLVIWGIKTGSDSKNYVALIGKENYITIADFRRAKINFLRQANQKYTQQNLEASTVNQIILNSLIQNELLKAEAARLGLIIGENTALEAIKNMPIFKNKEGKFDKKLFKNILAMNSISDSKFLNSVKDEIAINILNSIFTPYSPSMNLIQEFFNYKEQKRNIDLITIKLQHNTSKSNIDDKDIKKYYTTHKNKFLVPESRDVEYIEITPDAYKNKIKSLKEEAKTELSTTKTNSKESSDAQALENLLDNKINKLIYDETKAIEDEIAAGSNLKEIAAKYKLKYNSIAKITDANQLNIPKFDQFLKQVFSASENYPSEALSIDKNKILSGYYILNISKIYEPHHKPLDSNLKKDIIKLIEKDQEAKLLKEQAIKLYNLVLSEKKTLQDITKENSNIATQEMIINKSATNINANLLTSIFAVKKKNAYTKIFKSKDPYIFQFARVKEIQLPKQSPSPKKVAMIKTQLGNYMTTAINQEFLNYLYNTHSVKIFPKTLDKM